jgi:outer membrane protein assembly factor BamE (lipoprotein component of BamABCDE complex)
MTSIARLLWPGLLLCCLLGCEQAIREATTELKPGVASRDEVVAVHGVPAMEYREANGDVVLEFPKGPNGVRNLFATFGADGKLKSLVNVLTDAHFARLMPGQTRAEVRRILGKPFETVTFDLSKEEVWSWRYEAGGGTLMQFHAHFDLSGNLLRTTRTMEMPGGR